MKNAQDVLITSDNDLAALGIQSRGAGIRIAAGRLKVGSGVTIADGVTLAGDEIEIGNDVVIGEKCDLRSESLTIGARSAIHPGVRILVAESVAIGHASRILNNVSITCRTFEAGNLLFFGDHLEIGGGGHHESTARVRIGHRVALGAHTMLNANLPVELEDQVGSGDYLSIWTHGFHFGHSVLEGYGAAYAPVHIERNVWLAHHVTVMPGMRIGQNTIVAACSVVTKPLPANVMAAGAPAQVRKALDPKPLDDSSAWQKLFEILQHWLRELAWKGWTAQKRHDEFIELRSGDSYVYFQLLPVKGCDLTDYPWPRGILVSLYADEKLANGLPAGWSLLEIKPGSFHGSSFDVSEDLRDFLRRNSIPCGDDRLFRSILPRSFARLQSMV